MVLRGLTRVGADDVAADIGRNYHEGVTRCFAATGTVWENMAPEPPRGPAAAGTPKGCPVPGSPSKGDFVGWSGLGPVAVLFEYVFGLRADVPGATLVVDVRLLDGYGVRRYPFGEAGVLDIAVASRGAFDEPPRIVVNNDGRGVPVAQHAAEGLLVPELVFGHLLTGSNFGDEAASPGKARGGSSSSSGGSGSGGGGVDGAATGGRHVYGAKLTKIFSREFSVAIVDGTAGLRYSQTWRNNMSATDGPQVLPAPPGACDETSVAFVPDLRRFGGGGADEAAERFEIDEGTLHVMLRRVVDAAGTLARFGTGGAIVSLNGRPVPVASFADYAQLYSPEAAAAAPSAPAAHRR
jgi:hypothetical protein